MNPDQGLPYPMASRRVQWKGSISRGAVTRRRVRYDNYSPGFFWLHVFRYLALLNNYSFCSAVLTASAYWLKFLTNLPLLAQSLRLVGLLFVAPCLWYFPIPAHTFVWSPFIGILRNPIWACQLLLPRHWGSNFRGCEGNILLLARSDQKVNVTWLEYVLYGNTLSLFSYSFTLNLIVP